MDTKFRPFKVLLLDSLGKRRTVEFSKEDEAVKFLKETYRAEAPLFFKYLDGSPVEVKRIERMYRRVFSKKGG